MIGIGGEPCSGKTTVLRTVLAHYGYPSWWTASRSGVLSWQQHKVLRLVVLGDYRPGCFGGPDRLSMAVQPHALAVLRGWAASDDAAGYVVLFEGDRLFNVTFIRAIQEDARVESHWLQLTASPEVLTGRHLARGTRSVETWRAGARTRFAALADLVPGLVTETNETAADQERISALVLGWIEGDPVSRGVGVAGDAPGRLGGSAAVL